MARIEKERDVKDELAKMKGEMVKEVRRANKKPRPLLACSLILLALLVAAVSWVVWMVAATGMVQVPVFTALAYDAPVPERVVEPGIPLETVAEEQFRTELTKRLQAGGGTLTDDILVLSVGEASLTASVRSAIEESSSANAIDAAEAQVAVSEQGLELFLPVAESDLETALLVVIEPDVVDEVVSLNLSSVTLGSLTLPSFLVSGLFQPMLQSYVNELNEAMAGFATITDITTQEGWIELTSRFSVEITP